MKLEIVFKDGRMETFDSVASFNVTEEQTANEECHTPEVVQAPSEGKLFEVTPLEMDRSSFKNPMSDKRQEWTRQIIQEAFAEVDKYPEKYASPFYTLIPEKNWNGYKTVEELKQLACELGDHNANWVEQALEWAQRICNGESWEVICNNADTANWHRLVVWKNGYARLVGGSRANDNHNPASYVDNADFDSYYSFSSTVPLVVLKK